MEEIEYMSGRKIRREREKREALSGVEGIGYLHRKKDIRDRLSEGMEKSLDARDKVIIGASRVQGILGRYAKRAKEAQRRFKGY